MNEVAVEATVTSLTSMTGILASTTILMGALVLLSIIAMTLMYRYFNKVARQQNQIIEELKGEIDSISLGGRDVAKRLNRTDNKLKQLARRQYLYEIQQMKNRDYERAKKLITRGENVNKVLANCNITKTEAELIMLANKMNKVA